MSRESQQAARGSCSAADGQTPKSVLSPRVRETGEGIKEKSLPPEPKQNILDPVICLVWPLQKAGTGERLWNVPPLPRERCWWYPEICLAFPPPPSLESPAQIPHLPTSFLWSGTAKARMEGRRLPTERAGSVCHVWELCEALYTGHRVEPAEPRGLSSSEERSTQSFPKVSLPPPAVQDPGETGLQHQRLLRNPSSHPVAYPSQLHPPSSRRCFSV